MATQTELPGTSNQVTTKDILAALDDRYNKVNQRGYTDWIGVTEARAGAGYSHKDAERRIDYFAIHTFPSKNNHHRIAFEIKVSRSDWLRELKDPSKRRMGLMFSNEFYIVAPKGLIDKDEIPPECGLMTFDPTKKKGAQLRTVVAPPWRDSHPPTWSFFVSIARNVMRRVSE